MFRSSVLLVAVLAAAGAGEAVVAGPWMMAGPGDLVEIGVELTAQTGRAPRIACERGGTDTGIAPVLCPVNRPRQASTQVAILRLPAAGLGPCTIRIDGAAFAVELPARPGPADAVRVVVAGSRNWPLVADLERMAQALGGPVTAVVAVGGGLASCLGRGGWESRIPVLPLPATVDRPAEAGRDDEVMVERAVLGASVGWWPLGIDWGILGLPSGEGAERPRVAMARDLSPWQVHIARDLPWEPSLAGLRRGGRPADLAPLVGLCQRFRVPVVLAATGCAGWISEPLAEDKGRLVVKAGGTRFIGAMPSGDPLASLPDIVAIGQDRAGLVGMTARPGELVICVLGPDGDAPTQRLVYGVTGVEARRHGSGWGMADVEQSLAAWAAGGTQAAVALEELSWGTAASLIRLHLGNDQFARLVGSVSTHAAAQRLLRRLIQVEPMLTTFIVPALAQLPRDVARDVVLRQIARPRPLVDSAWAAPVTDGDDATLVRAVLAAAAGGDATMLELLATRLKNQAAGTVALEGDPLLQHRILCLVFEADTLSPTPLRPVALALRDKVDPLNKAPIERFLKRVGEKRPPGP